MKDKIIPQAPRKRNSGKVFKEELDDPKRRRCLYLDDVPTKQFASLKLDDVE